MYRVITLHGIMSSTEIKVFLGKFLGYKQDVIIPDVCVRQQKYIISGGKKLSGDKAPAWIPSWLCGSNLITIMKLFFLTYVLVTKQAAGYKEIALGLGSTVAYIIVSRPKD